LGDAASAAGLSPGAAEPCAWLLELGAAARAAEIRRRPGSLFRWSDRRARARSRRLIVQQALGAAAAPALDPPLEGEALLEPLLDRIGAYTLRTPVSRR
jgi:hypothetical protein